MVTFVPSKGETRQSKFRHLSKNRTSVFRCYSLPLQYLLYYFSIKYLFLKSFGQNFLFIPCKGKDLELHFRQAWVSCHSHYSFAAEFSTSHLCHLVTNCRCSTSDTVEDSESYKFALEGTSVDHPVQDPCSSQGQLELAAQGHVQFSF